MSKVDELIQQLCPDGVKYVALGEVTELKRGTSISKKNTQLGEVPVVAGGISPAYCIDQSNREGEVIVVAGSGANAGFVSFWNEPIFVSDAFSIQSHDGDLLLKYVYQVLKSKQGQLHALKKGGGVPHVYARDAAVIQIPLPPLEVQEEIVQILDQFVELGRELEQEIIRREKQFAAFRDSYLDSGWETMRLGDVVEYSRARVKSANLNPHDYTGVENLLQNFEGRIPEDKLPPTASVTRYQPGDVLLGNIRPYLKKAWLADSEGGASNDVLVLSIQQHSTSNLLPTWLYRVITGNSFLHYNVSNSKGAKMPRGDKKMILDYQIPLPPLEIQEDITTKLDIFTEYIDNLKRERELRQKQYEYYRDHLLDFKVKE